MCIIIYFVNYSATKPKGNIIIGATVPTTIMDDNELLGIIEEFKKCNKKYTIFSVIASLPLSFMGHYIFYAILYMMLWCIFIIILESTMIRNYFNKIQELKRKYDENYDDNDKYWRGFFYNNPNDKSFMVQKRFGIGTTINIAHPMAKGFLGVIMLITIGTLIFTLVIGYKLNDAEFLLTVNENKIIIEAPMYGMEFDKSEIEEVSKITELPEGIRTNGAETDDIALGNYKLDGYGKSNLFVYRDVKNIVVIKLKDKYLFITGKDIEETEKYYIFLYSILSEREVD
jgi:hypothetical protein